MYRRTKEMHERVVEAKTILQAVMHDSNGMAETTQRLVKDIVIKLRKLDQKLKSRTPGRPYGFDAVAEAKRSVARKVQTRQMGWCTAQGRKRVPWDLTKAWLNEEIRRMEAEKPEIRGKLSVETIRKGPLKQRRRERVLRRRRPWYLRS
jgi:hypothetical protein